MSLNIPDGSMAEFDMLYERRVSAVEHELLTRELRNNQAMAAPPNYGQFYVGVDLGRDVTNGRREHRFDTLRAEGKKLGKINQILCNEGFSETFGDGARE